MPFSPTDSDSRRSTLEEDEAIDVILNCTEPSQDAEFAAKYSSKTRLFTADGIRAIREGRSHYRLRQKLETD